MKERSKCSRTIYIYITVICQAVLELSRDNVHSDLCHAKRPMAVSFLTPTPPSSKQPFQTVKIFQHFEGPFFEVESIGLALCQYVTGAGFPSKASKLFFNNGRVYKNIKNEVNMEYACIVVTLPSK